MFNIIIRAVIFYFILLATMRLMGKREVGQLQSFEVIVLILIGELAANTIYDIEQPTLPALLTILTLVCTQNALGLLLLKCRPLHRFVSGTPSILIENGVIKEEALRRQRYTLADLTEELRANGCFSIEEVGCAVLETSGQISVQPAAAQRPLTPQDLGMKGSASGVPYMLILDGSIQKDALASMGRSPRWLRDTLTQRRLPAPEQVLIATLDGEDRLFLQTKGDSPKIYREVINI